MSPDDRAGPADRDGSPAERTEEPGQQRGTARERGDATFARWRPRHPRRAALAGVASFLLGYLLTATAFAVEMQSVQRGGSGADDFVSSVIDQAVGVGGRQVVAAAGGELAVALRAVGWTFLSAQHVPLFGTAEGLNLSASGTVDVLTIAGRVAEIPLSPALYYLIPPVCLAAAGWWFARSLPPSSSWEGAIAGAQVVVGYLPAMVVAALLLGFSGTVTLLVASATISAEPVFLRALLVGTGYPVVFGALGGVVAAKTKSR